MQIESQFDRSILSFFRFLKDHVNDSIIDFFVYAGFIAEFVYHQYKQDNLDKILDSNEQCTGFSGLSLPCLFFYSRITSDQGLFLAISIIAKSIITFYLKL